MTKELRLRQAGGSVSATLPKDMADRLHLEAGDRVLAVETDRGILLTPYDPEAEQALKVAAKAAKTYRNAVSTAAFPGYAMRTSWSRRWPGPNRRGTTAPPQMCRGSPLPTRLAL